MNFKKIWIYKFVIFPFLVSVLFFTIIHFTKTQINLTKIDLITNISGILAGFLFSTLGILITLPKTNFSDLAKYSKAMKSTYITIFSAIIIFIIEIVLALINLQTAVLYFFLCGLTNTILSTIDLFQIAYFNSQSE